MSRSPKLTKVLAEIDAEQVRQVVVWNKIDLTKPAPPSRASRDGMVATIARVRVSARSGEGLDLLRESLAEYARAKAEARQKALVEAAREAQNDYIN